MKTMKYMFKGMVVLLMAAALVLSGSLFSCGGGGGADPEPELTAGEKAVKQLVGATWKVSSVTIDDADKSGLFTNFTIAFSASGGSSARPSLNGSYTTTHGGVVWTDGTWTISNGSTAASFLRGDGVTVQLTELTATSLKMTLTWNKETFGEGRVNSIKGKHVFNMTK